MCRGTIEAEFWKKDVENIFNDKDSFVKVLEIKESLWPGILNFLNNVINKIHNFFLTNYRFFHINCCIIHVSCFPRIPECEYYLKKN